MASSHATSPQTLATCKDRIVKVSGPVRSGKTEAIVQRCATLLHQEINPQNILVCVSSAQAAQAFRTRLDQATHNNQRAQEIHVMRALDVCVDMLSRDEAIALTERKPRILNESELVFFLEDLKTLGQRNAHLHNMLLFFYAQWSNLEDEQTWLIPGEETDLLTHARSMLKRYGVMLRHEAPYLCAKLLESPQGRALERPYTHVFIDDFQNLSYAEQNSVCMCAKEQLFICGNASLATKVNTPYPSLKGFQDFARVRKDVSSYILENQFGIEYALAIEKTLETAHTEQEEKFISDQGFSLALFTDAHTEEVETPSSAKTSLPSSSSSAVPSPSTSILPDNARFVVWDTPEAELKGIANIVKAWCEQAGADASDITVAVPTKSWGRAIEHSLEACGMPVSCAGLGPTLGGDHRMPGKHDALSAYLALCLVANPHDVWAWRAFSGLDDPLARSEAWRSLHAYAEKTQLSLYDTFEAIAANTVDTADILKVDALQNIWEKGQHIIEACRTLTGSALVQALGMNTQAIFAPLVPSLDEHEDAQSLLARTQAWLISPTNPDNSTDCVKLATYENLCGCPADVVIMTGMVDGLIPARIAFEETRSDKQRAAALADGRNAVRACIPSANKYLFVSSCTHANIEIAERMKMKVARISSVAGQRQAKLNVSTYLKEARAVCPPFIEGNSLHVQDVFNT